MKTVKVTPSLINADPEADLPLRLQLVVTVEDEIGKCSTVLIGSALFVLDMPYYGTFEMVWDNGFSD
jgi:hypothetical protein